MRKKKTIRVGVYEGVGYCRLMMKKKKQEETIN